MKALSSRVIPKQPASTIFGNPLDVPNPKSTIVQGNFHRPANQVVQSHYA